MRIYIPTMGRGPLKQETFKSLPKKVCEAYNITIVCPPAEAKEFTKHGFTVLPCPKQGIAATRQFILDKSTDPIVLMLDDDLNNWSTRRQEEKGGSYTKATDAEIIKAFKEFEKLMKTHAHGAIGHRLFAQEKDAIYYNTRMLRALAYNVPMLQTKKVKFRMPVMEDFDVTLQLLKAGCPGVIYNRIVQDQRATNQPGGCSTYRTLELQAKAAESLRDAHPDCVQVVQKKLKNEDQWQGLGAERTDVRVNWRAAAKVGGLK